MSENTISLPQEVKDTAEHYFELSLGGKKVKCPYYMNLKHEKAGLRVMIGKGSVDEIIHEVMVWAQLKGIDLNALSEQEIRAFMIKKGIGIDCSGFVVYILDKYFQIKGLGRLWKNLKYKNNSLYARFRRMLRPVENIGANLLTSDLNCDRIDDINKILPGDLIRAKGKLKNAHHVAVITDVTFNKQNKVKEFKYVHSHRFYEEENGVRKGKVIITNPKTGLKDQKWEDNYQGKNYMLTDLLINYEDNGIRRLKALKNK